MPSQRAQPQPASTTDAVALEILAGLAAPQPFISPKFLYDSLGSRLFTAITELDEYYPTRTEAAIMAANLGAIASAVGNPSRLSWTGLNIAFPPNRQWRLKRVRCVADHDFGAHLGPVIFEGHSAQIHASAADRTGRPWH